MQSVEVQKFLAGKQFSAPETLSEALQILAKQDFPCHTVCLVVCPSSVRRLPSAS